jgi:hypothetical protein
MAVHCEVVSRAFLQIKTGLTYKPYVLQNCNFYTHNLHITQHYAFAFIVFHLNFVHKHLIRTIMYIVY